MQPQELRPGDVVAGKYRIRSILSENRGVLVEAFHTEFDQRVVIRLISPHDTDEKEVERFRRESRVLAKLESEHAARIIDVGTEPDGSFYLVRQYLDGVSLDQKLNQSGPLPVWDAVLFILQTAEVVAETHAHGIILRELSTSHLFHTQRLGGQPMVKLIDFGTAKLLRDESGPAYEGSEVTTTTMFGLSPYSSPELVRKDKGIDHRTDVWSLGAIFYEMVTGRPPFDGDMALLMLQITKEQPAPVQSLRPDVPANLVKVISQAMAKAVDSRFQDVYAFAKALSPFTPSAGKVLIERIGALHKATSRSSSGRSSSGQAPAHASAADDEVMEISQVEEISSIHSLSKDSVTDDSVTGVESITAPRRVPAAQPMGSLDSVGVDDDDDDDAPTRIAFPADDTSSEVTSPKAPGPTHRRAQAKTRPSKPAPRRPKSPSRPPPKKLSQEKTLPVGRSFVPVSPGLPPAPPAPPKKAERPRSSFKRGPVFAGAAANRDEDTAHLNIPAPPLSSPESIPPSGPNLGPPSIGPAPTSQPGGPVSSSPGLEARAGSWPGLAPRAVTVAASPVENASGGGRRAVVLVIAAACVLLPGLLGLLIFKSEESDGELLARQAQSASVVASSPVDGAPATATEQTPTSGAGGAAPTGEGGNADAPPDPTVDPTVDPTAAPPKPTWVGGPMPTAPSTFKRAPTPPSTPPPPSGKKKKPPASDLKKGTLVAIAVGGTCAFSVNGAAKGTTTTLKLSVKPGTYSVSCKPASGGTKSRSVRVKSGATAMAMFKL